jgi:cytochrome c553
MLAWGGEITMKKLAVLLCAALPFGAAAAAPSYPDWAYAVPTPENEAMAPKDDGTVFTLPRSKGRFTRSQISGAGHKPPADWYPGDHPAMPKLIAAGDAARGITACAACHYPNGKGRPQNAGIAGLNADYLARQLREMKAGTRKSAEPRKHNAQQMVDFAKAMTDAEMTEAAAYYAALPHTVPIRVVETSIISRMRSQEGMWLPHESGDKEPIGNRVIETPVNVDREQLRDPHAGFIAYVPKGATAKGKRLAAQLGCASCHGDDLRGVDSIAPAIAGRSPSYLARQLYDFQQGTRHGEMATQMQPVAAKLTGADIVNLTAYAASLKAH